MSIPFVHATSHVTPQDIDLAHRSRVILSEYRSFEHSLTSDVLSLKYVLEGMEEYTVNGKTFHVEEGQFLIVQPGDEVAVGWSSPDIVKGVCIYFEDDFVKEMLLEGHSSLLPTHKYVADRRLHKWFQSYLDGISTAEEGYWMGASITKELYGEYQSRSNRLGLGRESTKHALMEMVHRVEIHLSDNLNEPFSLDDLAERACMSKFHFLRMFKKTTGMTPQAYHQHLRFQYSVELLKKPGVKIQEVAWELGFQDVAAFSKFFKKKCGRTPSAYRNGVNYDLKMV